ncbi:DUF4400 domain-containing protein [Rheinheimera hassiensis]|uniref:DUF4400 domain-containing protein n=1 Tax=Rheinheimera hassiensis TaxID=1193627 RepID=UPI001F053DE3|nr:DUF4400 domain-containing protein [Rheinheimera hassiensis]
MTTVITKNASRFNVIYVILALLGLYAFAMIVIKDTPQYKVAIEAELNYVLEKMPEAEGQHLESVTQGRFQRWLYDSGAFYKLKSMFMPKDVQYQEEMSKGIFSVKRVHQVLNNLQYLVYQFIMRITLVEFWLYTMLPMMVAMVVTGYYNWKKKTYQLGGQSVNVVRLWLKVGWGFLLLMSSYLVIPNIAGAYTLFAPPLLMFIMALAISKIIQSFHKSF